MATRALPFAQRRGSTAFGRLTLGGAWAGLVLAVAGYWTVNPAVLAQTGANAAAVGPQAETAAGTVANANAGAVANAMAVDFGQDIIPLLSRHGCNAGGCHGKASGQNGFKLSLFGFDPQFDHEAIVRQARGRRLSLAAPGQSLLLTKATGQTPHGGGRRIEPGSAAYDQLYAWIAAGAPAANPAAPRLVGLRIHG